MRTGEELRLRIRGVTFENRNNLFREDGEEIMNSFDENTESWVTMSNNHLTCLFGVTPTLALGMAILYLFETR